MMPFRSKKRSGLGALHSPAADHLVHFYDEQDALLQSVASFLAAGLLRGSPALVIIRAEHTPGLTSRLTGMGVDVERALASRQLVLRDSASTVERIVVDGMPDERRFREEIGAPAASMSELSRPQQLLAFGDMVDVLISRGQAAATIELERLWDDLAHRVGISVYCAYDARRFRQDSDRPAFDAICRHHDLIVPTTMAERIVAS